MFAEKQYTPIVRSASILPSFDLEISNTVHWYEPNGTTRTGCLQSLDFTDGFWWGAASYELTPGFWATENRHAHNYFNGPGAEFPVQLDQPVWVAKRGNGWQACKVVDVFLEAGVWFGVVEYRQWYGIIQDGLPLDQIRTDAPTLDEDPEYSVWCDDRNDYEYEDSRDR